MDKSSHESDIGVFSYSQVDTQDSLSIRKTQASASTPEVIVSQRDAPCIDVPQRQLSMLCGVNDRNLRQLSRLFKCRVQCLGNQLSLQSPHTDQQQLFRLFVQKVLSYMDQGIEVQADLLDALFSASRDEFCQVPAMGEELFPPSGFDPSVPPHPSGPSPRSLCEPFYDPRETALSLNGRKILARNRRQHELLRLLSSHQVIFTQGPAGTGKTFLAVAYGLSRLLSGKVSLLLLSRPVVEAGESLGFLPGDFGQKISPYMMPLFDAMRYLLKAEQVRTLEAKGMIEVAPLAYMRGRSLRDAIVILDEAQNATPRQVKMLLTRLGEGSQAILTGDPSQSDLGSVRKSGLYQASRLLSAVEGIAVQNFRNEDVVRSALVRRIIQAYEREQACESKSKSAEASGQGRKARGSGA